MTRKRVARSLKERQIEKNNTTQYVCVLPPFFKFSLETYKRIFRVRNKTKRTSNFFQQKFSFNFVRDETKFIFLFFSLSYFFQYFANQLAGNTVWNRWWSEPREDKFRETARNDKREKFTRVWVIEDLARVAKIFFIPRSCVSYDLYAAVQHRRHLLLGMLALTGRRR